MQNQQVAQAEEVNPLAPPPSLSVEEKWIVRIHGKDMGPFSSGAIYTKLLVGQIDPNTLLLDETNFTRCRLSEVPEFQPYLGLHNTQNPILLEEQQQQEKEKHWEEVGRKRMIIGISSAVGLLVAGFLIWRFFIYQPEDIYMSPDGEKIAISLGSFKASTLKEKKQYDWKWKQRSRRGRRGGKKGKAGPGQSTQAFDFTKGGGGSGIPKAQLHGIITRKIRSVFSCFMSQMQRDGSFNGATTIFKINGLTGRVMRVSFEGGGRGVLRMCIQRRSRGWSFPKFQGNAEIYIPVRLNRRRRY